MAREFATRIHLFEAGKLLDANLDRHPDGTVSYKTPWTDELIAKQVGCKPSHVANLRLQVFGKFRSATKDDRNTELEKRIVALENLCLCISDRFTKLCTTLALQRIADVKHLGIPHDTKEPQK